MSQHEGVLEAVFVAHRGTIAVEIKRGGSDTPVVVEFEPGQSLPGWVGRIDENKSFSGPVYVYRDVRFQIVPVISDLESDSPPPS